MASLTLNITERASDFSEGQWHAWDAFLSGCENSSIHLSSGAIRAGLKSPFRQVMAAMWTDGAGEVQGVAVMEDSEAISQGWTTFWRYVDSMAKNWLREKGFRFACVSSGRPRQSPRLRYEGIVPRAWRCWRNPPWVKGVCARHMGRQMPLLRHGPTAIACRKSSWRRGGWIWNLTRDACVA